MTPAEFFLSTAVYDDLIAALKAAQPDHPEFENQIKIALGEVGNIWPASIRPEVDAMRAHDEGFADAANGKPCNGDHPHPDYLKGYEAARKRNLPARVLPVVPMRPVHIAIPSEPHGVTAI